MKKIYSQKICAFVLAFILTSGFSQGAYLKSGQSGFGIGAVFSSDDNGSGFSGSVGYSAEGAVDFVFNFAKGYNNTQLSGENVTTTGIGPSLEIHFMKQSSTTPFSSSLFLSYQHDFFNSEALDDMHGNEYANSFVLGTTVYGNIYMSPDIYFQPSMTPGYLFGAVKFNDGQGGSQSDELNTFLLGLGLEFVCRINDKLTCALGPGVSINDDGASVSISANLIFPMKPSTERTTRHKVYMGR